MAPPDLSISNTARPSVHPQALAPVAGARKATAHQHNLKGSETGTDGWVKIDRSKFSFSRQQKSASSLNAIARSIRVADRSMQKIGKAITKMKKELQVHLKNYPPYPPGSAERIKLLKSFAAFRKLISELTMPPDDRDAARIMADPATGTAPSGVTAEHNGFAKSIRYQPVHPGPGGLDIPALGEQADDKDLEAAAGKLDAAAITIESRRSGLLADATGVFNPPDLRP